MWPPDCEGQERKEEPHFGAILGSRREDGDFSSGNGLGRKRRQIQNMFWRKKEE